MTHTAKVFTAQAKWEDTTTEQFREKVVEKLSQRVLDRNLVLLIGSGASLAVGGPSMKDFWDAASSEPDFRTIVQKTRFPVCKEGDIESLLSHCYLTLSLDPDDTEIQSFVDFAQSMICEKCRTFLKPTTNLASHDTLLMKLANRPAGLPRLQIFTTNYDMCIERSASACGLPVVDGFSLSIPRHFDGRNFELDFVRQVPNRTEPSLVAGVFHLLKLHGSICWQRSDISIVQNEDAKTGLMIFPRESKYQHSFQYPFLEMMARFQFVLRQPNTTLLTIGFGFNDDHLVEPIFNVLRSNPQFSLVVATRSLEKHCLGENRNRHLVALSELAKQHVENILLLDMEFSQLVDILPAPVMRSDEDRVRELVFKILAAGAAK